MVARKRAIFLYPACFPGSIFVHFLIWYRAEQYLFTAIVLRSLNNMLLVLCSVVLLAVLVMSLWRLGYPATALASNSSPEGATRGARPTAEAGNGDYFLGHVRRALAVDAAGAADVPTVPAARDARLGRVQGVPAPREGRG